jgi:hypothetical protein
MSRINYGSKYKHYRLYCRPFLSRRKCGIQDSIDDNPPSTLIFTRQTNISQAPSPLSPQAGASQLSTPLFPGGKRKPQSRTSNDRDISVAQDTLRKPVSPFGRGRSRVAGSELLIEFLERLGGLGGGGKKTKGQRRTPAGNR